VPETRKCSSGGIYLELYITSVFQNGLDSEVFNIGNSAGTSDSEGQSRGSRRADGGKDSKSNRSTHF